LVTLDLSNVGFEPVDIKTRSYSNERY